MKLWIQHVCPGEDYSNRPCWTCRQRRVVCDTRLPNCIKCIKSGRECLGYGEVKPVVWVTGMASRGKMAGRTTFAPIEPPPRPNPTTDLALKPRLMDGQVSQTDLRHLEYFLHRCCSECVIYESDNPFKRFVNLIPDNKALGHVILALSATHRGNSSENNDPAANKREITVTGLVHEQKALQGLRQTISKKDQRDSTVALVLLFIWNDALQQQGRQSWRYHLSAMRTLISARRNTPGWDAFFGKYFEQTYAILSIFGSTLSNQYRSDVLSLFTEPELDAILQRAEGTSWTGCPAELLSIMYAIDKGDSSEIASRIVGFSCPQWAARHPDVSSRAMRIHLAESYKGAISIYAARSFPALASQTEFGNILDIAIPHLQSIPPEDSHFKGILWPAFVLGAEARDPKHRAIVLDIFQHLHSLLQTWAVKQATLLLQEIWESPSSSGSWLQSVRAKGLELFLV